MSMQTILDLVPEHLRERSGSVLYSGRSAFDGPSPVYLLGLNPGGDPVRQAGETIGLDIQESLARRPADWSAYADERWNGKPAGTVKMQPRILHMMRELKLDPRRVPAANVVFVRTKREADLAAEKASLLRACWPVHEAVIDKTGARTLLCLGGTAGRWVRDALGAHEWAGSFIEANARKWTSEAHKDRSGLCVITLAHPSIAAWNVPATDPTPLVRRMLARSGL